MRLTTLMLSKRNYLILGAALSVLGNFCFVNYSFAADAATIFTAHGNDKQACKRIVETLAAKKVSEVANLASVNGQNSIDYARELFGNNFAKNTLNYLEKNAEYVGLGGGCHGEPLTWHVPDLCVGCQVGDKRLKEIENLGESTFAWRMRQESLDGELESLSYPWDDLQLRFNIASLEKQLIAASKIYRSAKGKLQIQSWQKKAAIKLRQKTEAYFVLAKHANRPQEEALIHGAIVQDFIARLEKNKLAELGE